MAQALISVILEQLANFFIEKSRKQWQLLSGVEEEVKKLESNLREIQAVLEDAEEKQMKEKDIKLWLENLKEICYDMEDELDEWNTAHLKLQNASFLNRKVFSFIPCFSFCQLHDNVVKIKKINGKVAGILRGKDSRLRGRETKQHKIESVSFVDESKLHGRDEDKKNIKCSLLSKDEEIHDHLKIISILGIGGIGKTALAQLVYNDADVQTQFDIKLWVSVSNFFDLTTISKAIIIALEKHDLSSLPLQTLLEKIQDQIQGKKVFLVLDDVWMDKGGEWEPLKKIFCCGLEGSRILVTTRNESVTESLKSSHVCRLEKLSDEQCWLILRDLAFNGGDQKKYKEFEDIGQKIAGRCNGLPLVAKALGGILQTKSSEEEWKDILNNEIWKLKSVEEEIFKPWLLSYFNLPLAVKPCLLYCAIFPKDFLVMKQTLIGYWMVQGYLNSNENSEMELTGEEYFNFLATRGFFQNFRKFNNEIIACKMHDLIHEFLQFLTKNEFVLKSINVSEKTPLCLSSKTTRHLTMVLGRDACFPKSFVGAQKLRSLATFVHDVIDTERFEMNREQGVSSPTLEAVLRQLEPFRKKGVLTSQDMRNLFNHSKCLRLLHLNSDPFSGFCHLEKGIPKEIGKLIHLRYLNLSRIVNMKILPETVGELYNLQVLDLSFCLHFEKLPKAIGKLTNLRALSTAGCPRLTCYPKGLAKLTFLREAAMIIVRADHNDTKELSIGDLENLDRLTSVWIMLVGKTIDADEVKRAKFGSKTQLKELVILAKDFQEDTITKALNLPSGPKVTFLKDFDAIIEGATDAFELPNLTAQGRKFIEQEARNLLGLNKRNVGGEEKGCCCRPPFILMQSLIM